MEIFNATLQKILATIAERCHCDWDLMIPNAVRAYRTAKPQVVIPNFMTFGCKVSEPLDLVTGLPPDPVEPPTSPEYVQQFHTCLELAHQIIRDALGGSVRRAKK